MSEILNNKIINNINKKKIICKNILHMFIERKLIDPNKLNDIYNKLIKNINEVTTFEVKLLNDKTLLVNFIDFKITSLKKIDNIDKLINDGKHKVFVIVDIQRKIWEELINYNIEVFYNYELMHNLIDHDLVPEHSVLSEEEKEELFKSYICNRKQLPKILLYDRVSRYYNVKVNDVFRIKRKNLSSGNSIYYRIVIPSAIPDNNDII